MSHRTLTAIDPLRAVILLGFMAGLASCSGPVDEPVAVTSEAIVYGGHDYLFVTTAQDWWSARRTCEVAGYALATVNDFDEEQFLLAQERTHASGIPWWIGYSDLNQDNPKAQASQEGHWYWDDGSPNGFVNWAPGEPNNYGGGFGENCAMDNWSASGQWNDGNCDIKQDFVCERGSSPPANPTHFYSASDTANATRNTVSFAYDLLSAQPNGTALFTVGTCGVPGASTDSSSVDTFLRLFDPQGHEVASNDDACGTWASNISYGQAENFVSGTYVVRAGCYQASSCSGTIGFQNTNPTVPSPPAAPCGVIGDGEGLTHLQKYYSCNQKYYIVVDGTLVLHHLSPYNPPGLPPGTIDEQVWAAQAAAPADRLIVSAWGVELQDSNGTEVWLADHLGQHRASQFDIQDDGHLVLRANDGTTIYWQH